MFNMVFDGDPGFSEDDEISVVSEIRVNDIVVFEQVRPGQYQMRVLAAGEVDGYEGQTFRAGKGDEPGSVRMTAL
ncbi:MAG: hypothetical protein RBR20_14330 [Desulfobacterales bacterium]|jgi:hypothetical protein|nr:hypothetical protein [Desulfobacteraceae bacterium]MDD3993126.1 hypothetical protein [Desulfobacteraceae bacterium]MDY0313290.1 hypothetical protein [Desulfobacterales bacterium]